MTFRYEQVNGLQQAIKAPPGFEKCTIVKAPPGFIRRTKEVPCQESPRRSKLFRDYHNQHAGDTMEEAAHEKNVLALYGGCLMCRIDEVQCYHSPVGKAMEFMRDTSVILQKEFATNLGDVLETHSTEPDPQAASTWVYDMLPFPASMENSLEFGRQTASKNDRSTRPHLREPSTWVYDMLPLPASMDNSIEPNKQVGQVHNMLLQSFVFDSDNNLELAGQVASHGSGIGLGIIFGGW